MPAAYDGTDMISYCDEGTIYHTAHAVYHIAQRYIIFYRCRNIVLLFVSFYLKSKYVLCIILLNPINGFYILWRKNSEFEKTVALYNNHDPDEKTMLTIRKTVENNKATLAPAGRLDSSTAPTLESAVKEVLSDITDLTFDFEKLEYISSAGLRVLLSAQKEMNAKGKMKVTGVNETIMEIFEVTGFSDILTIESREEDETK